jgi:hypothetical protein
MVRRSHRAAPGDLGICRRFYRWRRDGLRVTRLNTNTARQMRLNANTVFVPPKANELLIAACNPLA